EQRGGARRPSRRRAGGGRRAGRHAGAAGDVPQPHQQHHGESLEPTATYRYDLPHAKVAELADAQDSGSCGLNTRGGSSPPFRTYRASRWRSARILGSSFPRAGANWEYGGPIAGPFRTPRRASRVRLGRHAPEESYPPPAGPGAAAPG